MEVTNLISNLPLKPGTKSKDASLHETTKDHISDHFSHDSTAMMAVSPKNHTVLENGYSTPPDPSPSHDGSTGNLVAQQASSVNPPPKHVAFELLLDEESKMKARIPMRVQIFPHDTTDSIVTTVKNFYGIYDGTGSGVSFEDENATTLIARYENLRNNMTVYVRVIPNHGHSARQPYYGGPQNEGAARPCLGEPFRPSSNHGRPPSRPTSRVSRKRSASPSGRGRRSASTQKAPRSGNKSRGSSTHGSFLEDALVPYSDSDGGHASITSSKKGRNDHFASSDISMENILHDGRRKRPKFDSSELPLFAPPQVPRTTSTSSISPQRRTTIQDGASPFARPAHPFGAQHPLHSPQGLRNHEQLYSLQGNSPYATPGAPHHGHHLRERTNSHSVGSYGNRVNNYGILPTPDPTIASCISDEDVAMQLIRLGDASNFSHGRTSLSTADDAFSGIVDASSTGATSDGEMSGDEDILPHKTTRMDHDGCDPSSDGIDGEYQPEGLPVALKSECEDGDHYDAQAARAKRAKHKPNAMASAKTKQGTISKSAKVTKARSTTATRKTKSAIVSGTNKIAPPPPPIMNAQVARKASGSGLNFQHQLAADEEDLSTKPRCQRCRKSKKGCDRQRPCQRCRDAGIGIEGCISEDEGNGRKGRYGRHMGVPIKKVMNPVPAGSEPQTMGLSFASASAAQAASKKRKR
ncbi:C6 zinc finger domain-containing protein [Coccidioides immitis RS]|uniref:C6 zinc finger domain-containing protein n=2 Tax=Coccidioides immitis TaxID=5501 RepID=J3K2K2_COCIM|nr:C6 zinc finger domain-containing protein [Coccidioides immitis RS]EAS28323.3 C6 zinc finger domain-containing protein [Coccidioides immitis RS]KMU75659.1 hypothetical protein CISG_04833 [Coccidioides immitis RMSCC 3703]TPX20953.1 hypothetical protein DIZ76_016850 [Coccidioides immitis]